MLCLRSCQSKKNWLWREILCLKSRNPVCFKQIAQLATVKQNPKYGHFSKGGRNEASGNFSNLILDHANDYQPPMWLVIYPMSRNNPTLKIDFTDLTEKMKYCAPFFFYILNAIWYICRVMNEHSTYEISN